jgi:NAD(P)-dependent dehydrogenase (short-subunit alcohol dehydrogenase family)
VNSDNRGRADVKSFESKISIVTGAASGIGRELAEQLARHKSRVVLTDIDEAVLSEITDTILKRGHSAESAVLDVRDPDEVKKVIDATVSKHGRIDYLFNNAGIGVGGEACDFSYDDWRNVIDINLYGVVNGVFAAYPIMVKQGFWHIVNTASIYGLVPAVGEISYVASKYGVVGLSNALRTEAAAYGVKVSVLCPGFIDTPLLQIAEIHKYEREKFLELVPDPIPVDRCVEEILRGVQRNKATIVVTPFAKLIWRLHRLSPALVRWSFGRTLKKLRATLSD